MFSYEGPDSILDFASQAASVAKTQFRHPSGKAPLDHVSMNGCDCLPIKHYLEKQVEHGEYTAASRMGFGGPSISNAHQVG